MTNPPKRELMMLIISVLQTSISPIKKKNYSNIHLLYCLSDIDHITVTSICKFFVVKFILILAFFIHLMEIRLHFY